MKKKRMKKVGHGEDDQGQRVDELRKTVKEDFYVLLFSTTNEKESLKIHLVENSKWLK